MFDDQSEESFEDWLAEMINLSSDNNVSELEKQKWSQLQDIQQNASSLVARHPTSHFPNEPSIPGSSCTSNTPSSVQLHPEPNCSFNLHVPQQSSTCVDPTELQNYSTDCFPNSYFPSEPSIPGSSCNPNTISTVRLNSKPHYSSKVHVSKQSSACADPTPLQNYSTDRFSNRFSQIEASIPESSCNPNTASKIQLHSKPHYFSNLHLSQRTPTYADPTPSQSFSTDSSFINNFPIEPSIPGFSCTSNNTSSVQLSPEPHYFSNLHFPQPTSICADPTPLQSCSTDRFPVKSSPPHSTTQLDPTSSHEVNSDIASFCQQQVNDLPSLDIERLSDFLLTELSSQEDVEDFSIEDQHLDTPSCSPVARKSRRRMKFTNEQLATLEYRYKLCSYIEHEERKAIAEQLNIEEKHIIKWFENMRHKQKIFFNTKQTSN